MGIIQEVDESRAVKSPEEMKAEIEGKEPSAEQQYEKLDDPRLAKEWTFPVFWTDPTGKVWKGDFTNRILNYTRISQVGALKARMSGGVPLESLDDYTMDHNEKVSHLTISLIGRPTWAADLGELLYKEILDMIYTEVARHEAIFSGRQPVKKAGPGGGGNREGAATELVETEV